MNGHILCGETVLRLPSARVAREDVEAFCSSADLLERAKVLKQSAAGAAQEAEKAGYERGIELASAEMRDALAETLASLAQSFAEENERRERSTAAAAMQVVERLIGQTEDAAIVAGLAHEALRTAGSGSVTVSVAPEWAETVRARLSSKPDVTVEADPELGPFGCRIASGDGRIIADLDTQLASLRTRWGLDG